MEWIVIGGLLIIVFLQHKSVEIIGENQRLIVGEINRIEDKLNLLLEEKDLEVWKYE